MADTLRRYRWWALGGLLVAGIAVASPWDIDMIDSRAVRAYETKMRPPYPPGVVQRADGGIPEAGGVGSYQNDYIPPGDRTNAAVTDTMQNPYPVDDATLAQGARLFQVTCAPCHGIEGKGNGPVTRNDPANNIRRFPIPAPLLSGPGSVSAARSDGYIYLTIRNGGALMPAYGISLTDRERWSIVAYIRTLDGAQYNPPAPNP